MKANLIEGKHLGNLKLLPAKPGTCKECATNHDPTYPHNNGSMFYKYQFYNEHGRWPDWKDAMNHCSDSMKQEWISQLKSKGIEV